MSNTLCDILSNTLSLLSQKLCERLADDDQPKTPKEICQKLVAALSEFESTVGNDLNAAFVFLRTAVADLEICFENVEESGEQSTSFDDNPNGDQRLIFYTPLGSQLERELCKIKSGKAKDKFSSAITNFHRANDKCRKTCDIATLGLQTRITATKFRVIAEILGNLENLNDAAENCMKIISELHDCREIQRLFNAETTLIKFKRFVNRFPSVEFEETKNITSVVKISEVVLSFRKRFIRKPVAIFDWPVVKEEGNPQTFHPIIGKPPMKLDRSQQTMPDMSTSNEKNVLEIDATISTINCKGEVFAKYKNNSSAIVKIAESGLRSQFWSSTDEEESELKIQQNVLITSISMDYSDCTVLQNPDGNGNHDDCKNKLYVLAICTSEQQSEFVLFVIDVHGKLLHTAKLTFLPRRGTSETARGKIFCTKDKLLIFDIYRCQAYVCDKNGELETPLNTKGKTPDTLMASTILCDGKKLILEAPNKINFHNKSFSPLQFEAKYEVRAMTYNYTLDEINLLCRSGLTSERYRLMRYTRDGKLEQDIKLQEDLFDFSCVSLVSHPAGPVVLFDNNKLLYLSKKI